MESPNPAVAPLLEAAHRLKSIQLANEVASWTWDILNDRVVADQNLARLFGISPEVASGGPIERYIECIHPDDRDDVKSGIAEVLEGPNNRYVTTYRVVRKDGGIPGYLRAELWSATPTVRPFIFPVW